MTKEQAVKTNKGSTVVTKAVFDTLDFDKDGILSQEEISAERVVRAYSAAEQPVKTAKLMKLLSKYTGGIISTGKYEKTAADAEKRATEALEEYKEYCTCNNNPKLFIYFGCENYPFNLCKKMSGSKKTGKSTGNGKTIFILQR